METWDAIRSRRNVRAFDGEPMPDKDLDQILEAGRRAPSSQNWQPWDFVVVTKPSELAELATVWRGAGHVAEAAAAVALIAPVPADERQIRTTYYDLGQATVSMMIAAADLGIGSCHAGVGDQDKARRLLRFPADRFCAYLVSFGYPAAKPLSPVIKPDRRPFDEMVHRNHW
jgi:nitroreductase